MLVKKILIHIVALLFFAVLLTLFLVQSHGDLPVSATWAIEGDAVIPEGSLTVRFSGTSTLLFSDGKTHWMVDGWFSRPGPLSFFFGTIEPDLDAITFGLAANSVSNLAAVIPIHSHYDHAMDSPEVAHRTGALLMGSESTANIGRGWGLSEDQIVVLTDRQPFQLGDFKITPIESVHFQFPDPEIRATALGNPEISSPLVPPVRATDYRLGKAYVLVVEHPKGSLAIIGSAGYEIDGLRGYHADIVFLGVGGLGGQTQEYRNTFWNETVGVLKPSKIVPIHYDSLTAPIDQKFVGQSIILEYLAGSEDETLPFLEEKEGNSGVTLLTLPRYDEVVIFE